MRTQALDSEGEADGMVEGGLSQRYREVLGVHTMGLTAPTDLISSEGRLRSLTGSLTGSFSSRPPTLSGRWTKLLR